MTTYISFRERAGLGAAIVILDNPSNNPDLNWNGDPRMKDSNGNRYGIAERAGDGHKTYGLIYKLVTKGNDIEIAAQLHGESVITGEQLGLPDVVLAGHSDQEKNPRELIEQFKEAISPVRV